MTVVARGWVRFWNQPATWKVLALVVGYLVFYLAVGRVVGLVFDAQIDEDDVVSTAASIMLGIVLPIAIGAAALVAFSAQVGWLRDVFGPQPIRGSGWMWIAPVLAL